MRKASEDALPSQLNDDEPPDHVLVENKTTTTSEQVAERILRAERVRRGGGYVRRVLVKWKNFAEPNWEDRVDLEDVEALDKFEARFLTKILHLQQYTIGSGFRFLRGT